MLIYKYKHIVITNQTDLTVTDVLLYCSSLYNKIIIHVYIDHLETEYLNTDV